MNATIDPRVREERHELHGLRAWSARLVPDHRLAGLVVGVQGYEMASDAPLSHVQPPFAGLPLILGWADPVHVSGETYREPARATAFMAGLHDRFCVTALGRRQAGVQIDLTPVGAIRLLRRPLKSIANATVDLADLLGFEADALVARLVETRGWTERLRLAEAFLLDRLGAGETNALAAWTWDRLARSRGAAAIDALAREAGVSRKHLTATFGDWFGLPPKALARVLRFDAAVKRIRRAPEAVDWARLAAACGYYDQPHFNRDFRAFAGLTPSEYVARLQPTGGVLAS